jgi:hypothetical protein
MSDTQRQSLSLARTPVRRALARADKRFLLLLFVIGLIVGLLWNLGR